MGMVNGNLEKQAASMPNKPPTMAGGSFSGPPKVLALNLAVFSAVQGGLTLAVKKYRGKDDITTNMIGMLGAGAALSLTTNLGDQPAAPGQVNPQHRKTLNSRSYPLEPKPWILNPESKTLDPKTPNPKP